MRSVISDCHQKIRQILDDGEWHALDVVLVEVTGYVPFNVAYRIAKRPSVHVDPDDPESPEVAQYSDVDLARQRRARDYVNTDIYRNKIDRAYDEEGIPWIRLARKEGESREIGRFRQSSPLPAGWSRRKGGRMIPNDLGDVPEGTLPGVDKGTGREDKTKT